MQKKQTLIAVIILGLICLVSFSYAIIAPEVRSEGLPINSSVSTPLVFTAEGASNISTTVDFGSMAQEVTTNVVSSVNDTVTISLTTDAVDPLCCTYDLVWVWAETAEEKNQYTRTDATLEEYVVKGQLSSYILDGDTKNILSTDSTEYKGHVPDYGSEDNTLFSGQICNKVGGSLYPVMKEDFALTIEFYNLALSQDHLKGALFDGSISVANVQCAASS